MTDIGAEIGCSNRRSTRLDELRVRAARNVRELSAYAYGFVAGIGERASVSNPTNAAIASEIGMPEYVVRLVIAIEDKRYWIHPGTDPIGVVRAAWMNARGEAGRQGASTIREQIAKFGCSSQSQHPLTERLSRAAQSVISQLILGDGRKEILIRYLREVYVGRSCFGLCSAAQHYFGIDVSRISESQALFLVDRIALPNRWRAGRVRNILKRRIVFELVKRDLDAIPGVYKQVFGPRAGLEISSVINELKHDGTRR